MNYSFNDLGITVAGLKITSSGNECKMTIIPEFKIYRLIALLKRDFKMSCVMLRR